MKFETIDLEWQRPVVTELSAYELLLSDAEFKSTNGHYFAYPWATLLDSYKLLINRNTTLTLADYVSQYIQSSPRNVKMTITVCQTYDFKELMPIFNQLGIRYIFSPHAVKREFIKLKELYDVKVLPFPLFPVNTVQSSENRSYLYSFIGYINYKGGLDSSRIEATKLRNDLVYKIKHTSDSFVFPIENWHFNSIVYKRDLQKKKLNPVENVKFNKRTKRYKEVLAKSRYALCPKGMGPATIRFWEALGSGAIPVNISDDFWFPGEDYFDWSTCVINVKESELLNVPDILKSIPAEKESKLRENALKAFKAFNGNNFISPIKYKLLGKL